MFKKKLLCIALTILSANLAYGNMKEDVAFLNELYKQEKYDMAVSQSKKFILTYPDSKYNKNICERMAKVYFIQKNYKESEMYFQKFLTEYKLKKDEKIEAYSYLYKINKALSNEEKANEYIEAIKDSKLYEKTLYDSGVVLLNSGRNSEAIKEFSNVVRVKGDYYEPAILYLAMGVYNNGQYQDSIKYLDFYNGLQSSSKDEPLLTYLYGSSYYKLNDLNKAINYFEEGIRRYPNSSYSRKGRITLIEIYSNRREIDKALKVYSEIDRESEKKLGARVLADYFLAREEYKRAINFYDIIGENKPDSVRYTYAYAYYKLQDYKRATNEFKKIKDEKYLSNSRYYSALSYYNLKDYKNAITFETYLPSYELDSKKYTDLSVVFGNSYYELNNNQKAYEYYKGIYKDYPTVDNLYRVIVLQTKVDDELGAKTSFETYKKDFSDDKTYKKDVYLAMGNYFYKKDNVSEAESIYKEYMKTDKDVEIGNNLVNLLVNEKKYSEVIQYINKMEPTDDSTYLKGIAYMGIGEYAKADELLLQIKNKEGITKELKEKTVYNIIKNKFLWEKYKDVIQEGEEYLQGTYIYGLDDIVDRIGLSYYRIGDYEKSREYFSKLSVVPEYSGYARFQIADTYYAQKNYEKAKSEYKLVYSEKNGKKYEEDAKYWELNCDINLNNKDMYLENSEKFLNEYKNSPYVSNILLVRGNILSEKGDTEKAVKEYENLYEKTEQIAEKDSTVEKIIEIYDKTDNIEAKSNWIEKFSDKYKKSYYKSIAYREKNMISEAQTEEKILFENAKYKDYVFINRGNDNFNEQKYLEAEKNYKEIKNMESSQYKDLAVFQLGNIYAIKGENDKAEVELSKLLLLYPQSQYVLPAKLKLADVYDAKGDKEKAKDGYKELLQDKNAIEYKEYLVEKMLYISLDEKNKEEAQKYYEELKKLNKETAMKYDEFMKEETENNLSETNKEEK
ncbi:tetratricopeptide repeat protein [Fusobacterium sp.]|uniref:tetratricopeptide repeat protein n=1 Tax=Fusobacterium sp. TaxID=68766 RepID=UPI00260FDACD|nr:tetratricopeptide repeat protein [Fusobacterium sp.]